MVRNRFHFGFIHRLRTLSSECSASGNDPVFGGHRTRATSTGLDAVGINAQLGFAASEISLGIDGAFRRQILALLCGFGIADDDQLVVCVLLQILGNVVQFAFAFVVHAPRLVDLVHVREVALGQLAGLRRRWRRWVFNRHLRRGLRIQTTRVGTSGGHRYGSRGRAGGIQSTCVVCP